jgi:hypothetical protein
MDELLHHDAIIRERIIGKSVRTIARDHGCSIAEVNKALDLFAVATINAKVRTHTLALELSRLDELQSVFYERAKTGDVASGMLLTKIMERRSLPARLEQSGPGRCPALDRPRASSPAADQHGAHPRRDRSHP